MNLISMVSNTSQYCHKLPEVNERYNRLASLQNDFKSNHNLTPAFSGSGADAMEQETDRSRRDDLIRQATKLYVDDYAYIPLHQQAVVWAMHRNVDLVQPADNGFPLRFVTVK